MEAVDLSKEAESITTMVAMILAISMQVADKDASENAIESTLKMATGTVHDSLKKLRLKLRDEMLADVQLGNKSLETAITKSLAD